MRIWLIISVVCFCCVDLAAQCPSVSFTSPTAACINENILFENSVDNSVSYSWDFCSGDLNTTPTAQAILTDNFLFRTRAIRIIKHNSNWFGFTIDQANSPYKLIRFDFGTNLRSTPTVTDLGNPSNALSGAYDFQLYEESGIWYALVVNTGANNLLKYTFGANPDAVPTVQNLGSLGILNEPNGITLITENNLLKAFITNGATSQIVRLNFGSSINNTPTVNAFSVTGGATLRGIALIKECDRWMGLVSSYGNGKVFWLDFNNGLDQPALSGEITFFTSYNFPAGVSLVTDGGEYFAFIQSALGELYKLSFDTSIVDKSGTGQNFGNLGISNENFAIELVKEQSDWTGFSMDLSNRRLVRYTFPVTCSATPAIYTGSSPPLVQYGTSGVKKVSLEAKSLANSVAFLSKDIVVSSSTAPDITFTSQNVCAGNNVLFNAQNISGGVASYNWDFGDSNNSASEDPIHQFATAGNYQVQLEITGTNACKNLMVDTLSIYAAPVANFSIPAANPLCTNQQLVFDNTSVVDPGYPITWQWAVNATPATTQEDLSYTFTNTSLQQIKLTASIPGCQSEVTKNINTLVTGPSPDFTITGQCEDANISFADATTGSVSGYTWDFGNGTGSNLANPIITYADPGNYTITLTVSNAAGCNNSISKPRRIYSKPVTNFTALAPPFSCSGTATVFNDLTPPPTDSNLTTRSWNFGDPGNPPNTSAQINPQHIYPTAGDYSVSLTVSTNFACQTTLQKTVTIHQTPTADFTHGSLCAESPVNFSDASPGTNQAWSWQIGSSFYTVENPAHTFNTSGNHDVTLSVTALNNCIGSITKNVVIPPKLALDFSVNKNCRNQLTEFVNLTNDAIDPITNVSWNFNNAGTATIDNPTFTFLSTGIVNVTLTTQVQSGCTYALTKAITIAEGPLAAFTASPNSGEAPLEVQFINNSLNANSFLWYYNNQPGNTQPAPTRLFEEAGVYSVKLVATDAASCSDTTNQIIEVLRPLVFDVPYPNPSTGEFTIKWKTEENVPATFLLVDAMGRPVQEFTVISEEDVNTRTFNITGRPSGVYILRISYRNKVKSYRLIISQ